MSSFRRLIPLALLLCCPAMSLAGDLEVSANTPDIEVSTRPAGRNFMRLPALRYDMVLTTACPALFSARAVSLSIADTRIALDADRLNESSRVEVSISVPAAQIAPVAVEGFCTDDDGEQASTVARSLKIPSVLSAQAALTCADEETTEITYASAALDVILRCEPSDEPAEPSSR